MWTRENELERMLNSMNLFKSRLGNVFQEFDAMARHGAAWENAENYPRTNLFDNGDNLEVSVEMPGLKKENINIKLQGNYLELSGKRTRQVMEGYTTHRTEREEASFTRSFTLPYDVDADKVTAVLKNGILRMMLPKSEAAKPKQITIN